MKQIFLDFTDKKANPLYIQLYNAIKSFIQSGELKAGDRLPSLRKMAENLGVSVMTSSEAYNQLLTEGYIVSRPRSGFYVADIPEFTFNKKQGEENKVGFIDYTFDKQPYLYDLSCFDFDRWKKCMIRVFNEYSHLLLFESDVQGEAVLRYEIAKYLYYSRGVNASPNHIVVAAGTQQLTSYLSRILKEMDIGYVCTEEPGYAPIQNTFRDYGFSIGKIPAGKDEISIESLPVNIPSAVYVSPSNRFPTGSVMPVKNRLELISWSKENGSIIIEDDYDSELRFTGKPVPALQGLDPEAYVVYFGSFSSTLFPAVKISYMVLPEEMNHIFNQIKGDYTQTSSKTEQLTLALYMEEGYYYTNIRKLRSLCSRKLEKALVAFDHFASDFINPVNTGSGFKLLLEVNTKKDELTLSSLARSEGLYIIPSGIKDEKGPLMIFYYNRVPEDMMITLIEKLSNLWRK